MRKYTVRNGIFNSIYKGFDEEYANNILNAYNNLFGGYYIIEEEIDEPEELNDNKTELMWPRNRELTAIYGTDDAIKEEMKTWIEAYTGKKVLSFELSYNDPGDSGDEATFFADNIVYDEHLSPNMYSSTDPNFNKMFGDIVGEVENKETDELYPQFADWGYRTCFMVYTPDPTKVALMHNICNGFYRWDGVLVDNLFGQKGFFKEYNEDEKDFQETFGNPLGHIGDDKTNKKYPQLKHLDYHNWLVEYKADPTKLALIVDIGNGHWYWDGVLLEKWEVKIDA